MQTPNRLRTCLHDDPVLVRVGEAAAQGDAEVLLVGGYLRDRITGRPARDFDFLIRGDAKPILDRLARGTTGRITFRKAGVTNHRLMFGDTRCDFVTMSRRRTVVEELRRRDFTINTLILDLRSGQFTDPLGGLRDLRAERIRDVGPDAIGADPLRILRGIRLACDLPGFRIMPATRRRMAAAAAGLHRVSVERIREEVDRILVSGRGATGLMDLRKLGVLFRLLPELEPMASTRQAGRSSVFDHSLLVVGHIGRWRRLGRSFHFRGDLTEEDRTILGYAALFHDLGKPETFDRDPDGSIHFHGHEKISAARAGEVGRRFRFSTSRRERIERLALHHLRPGWLTAGDPKEAALRRVIRDLGGDLPLLLLLSIADRRGSEPRGRREDDRHREICRSLYRLFAEKAAAILDPPRLLSGREVMVRLGIGPGPRVGMVLRRIRALQEEGRIATRTEALRAVRDIDFEEEGGSEPAQ
jgi:poly(A) polymerase